MIAFGSMSNKESVTVKKNSVLTINFKTDIIDSPTEEQQSIFDINSKSTNILIMMVKKPFQKLKTNKT